MPVLYVFAATRHSPSAPAFPSAVPVLCTDPKLAAHTRVRGTAVIVDAKGILLTAAHVIVDSPRSCVLTVLVPTESWSRAMAVHTFFVSNCTAELSLDVAVCHMMPVERGVSLSDIPVGRIKRTSPAEPDVTITGFWGWGLFPVARKGSLQSGTLYRQPNGSYCDFATDVQAFEGMSGSPVVTNDGEIIGLITTAGTKGYSGTSFGISLERAGKFLRANGVGDAR